MNAITTFAIFLGDAGLVSAGSWLLAGALHPRPGGLLEGLAGWLLAALLLVGASAVALGALGALGPLGFFGLHAAVLAGLAVARRRQAGADWRALTELPAAGRNCFRQPGGERWAAGALVTVLVFLFVLAALGQPQVYDALTYRLPRIGQWLQDGRISFLTTDDERLNYMAIGPDLVVAWLLGAWPSGFQFAALAQWLGGVLLLGATIGLARQTGLSRLAALGAAALVLGMGNVAPQMTSLHTDLFAAGVFAASFYLWLAAARRGEGTGLGGAGVAFAVAAKGTVFYLLPGALVWVAWFGWRHRVGVRGWGRTLAGAAVAALVFVLPPMLRNQAAYGNLAAPADGLLYHYGPGLTLPERVDKLALNLRSSAVQLFDPNSQPWWLRGPAETIARSLAAGLPAHDPYVMENQDRRAVLLSYLGNRWPDADFATFGVLPCLLFAAGAALAGWRWREQVAQPVLIWALGIGLYLVTQHALIQWHPWGFRYAVLVAPGLAITAAWAMQQAPRPGRLILWVVALASGAMVFADTTWYCNQSGRRALPGGVRRSLMMNGWRDWAEELGQEAASLRVAEPGNRPLGNFYRLKTPCRVQLARWSNLRQSRAEQVVAGEVAQWLVVPALTFAGREGRVYARTWLDEGEGGSTYSLAAYRALRPGETPPPVLYRHRGRRGAQGVQYELQLRSWLPAVRLELVNPSPAAWSYEIAGPAGVERGLIRGGAALSVALGVAPDGLTAVTVSFIAPAGDVPTAPAPVVVAVRLAEGAPAGR